MKFPIKGFKLMKGTFKKIGGKIKDAAINFTESVKAVGRKWLNEHGIEAASKIREALGNLVRYITKGNTKKQDRDQKENQNQKNSDEIGM